MSDLLFNEKRNVALRSTTVTVIRLVFYRLLGVEKRVVELETSNKDLQRRVKALEGTLYNYQSGQEELLAEIKGGGQ